MKPKRTILCVDDNEQSLSIRKVLLETRGYRVLTCATGEEALERFKKGGVDLVLTDLIMPGLDGTRLIEQIKPDVLVKGADYTKEKVVGWDIVEACGGRIALAPLVDGRSTSSVIAKILEAYK